MKRIYYKHILLLFLLIPVSTVGQSIPFLGLWPDPAVLAMGGTGTVATTSAFSLYNNSAAAVWSEGKGAAQASYTLWQTGLINHMGALSGFFALHEKHVVSVGSRLFLHPESALVSPLGIITGMYKPIDFSVDVGYAYKVAPKLSVGATLYYIRSQMSPEHTSNAFACDVGLLYKQDRFSLGLTAKNLGTPIQFEEFSSALPARVELGAGVTLPMADNHILQGNLQGSYMLYYGGISAGVGLKYTFKNFIGISTGFRYGTPDKEIPSFLSAGLDITWAGLKIQGTWLYGFYKGLLTNSLSIGLGWIF
jgi:hypothetical protein